MRRAARGIPAWSTRHNADVAIEEGLQAELAAAMRRRDTAVVAVLRSASAALANAQSRPPDTSTPVPDGTAHVAGASAGLRSTEVPRLVLDEDERRAILSDEAAELAGHVDRLTRLCRLDEADGARRGLTVLRGLLEA